MCVGVGVVGLLRRWVQEGLAGVLGEGRGHWGKIENSCDLFFHLRFNHSPP